MRQECLLQLWQQLNWCRIFFTPTALQCKILACRFYISYTVLRQESRVEEQLSWNTMLVLSPACRSILYVQMRSQASTRWRQLRRMPHGTNVGTHTDCLMSQIHTNKPVSRFTKQSWEQRWGLGVPGWPRLVSCTHQCLWRSLRFLGIVTWCCWLLEGGGNHTAARLQCSLYLTQYWFL